MKITPSYRNYINYTYVYLFVFQTRRAVPVLVELCSVLIIYTRKRRKQFDSKINRVVLETLQFHFCI